MLVGSQQSCGAHFELHGGTLTSLLYHRRPFTRRLQHGVAYPLLHLRHTCTHRPAVKAKTATAKGQMKKGNGKNGNEKLGSLKIGPIKKLGKEK